MALPEEYLRLSLEDQKVALRRAIRAYRQAEPDKRKEAGRLALIGSAGQKGIEATSAGAGDCPSTDQQDKVRVWQPMVDGAHKHALSVPFAGTGMNREQFMLALQCRLEELILADPKSARRLMTNLSPEYSPDLYTIALHSDLDDWPVEIVMSDQLMTIFNQIDFDLGQIAYIPASELPGIHELLESL